MIFYFHFTLLISMNHTLKPQYVNNVPFLDGELTIVTSDHAEASMRHSSRLANSFRKAGLNVLVINCGMSDRRFRSHYYDAYGEDTYTRPMVVLKTSRMGNVIGDREGFDQIIREGKIGVVILVGWEFASSTTRRRNRLFYYLQELMEAFKLPVIVYSQTAGTPIAGMMGPLGKLGAAAFEIVQIDTSSVLEEAVKKPPVLVWESQDEMQKAEEGVQQLLMNINQLAPPGGGISGFGVGEEGRVVSG
jgi:hypothetical protein